MKQTTFASAAYDRRGTVIANGEGQAAWGIEIVVPRETKMPAMGAAWRQELRNRIAQLPLNSTACKRIARNFLTMLA